MNDEFLRNKKCRLKVQYFILSDVDLIKKNFFIDTPDWSVLFLSFV